MLTRPIGKVEAVEACLLARGGGGGTLLYIGDIGMCRCEG